MRRALSGIRRIRSTPPVRRSPLLLEDIRALLQPMIDGAAAWPAGVGARRDAALLLMGFAGAQRRSELVGLTLADVTLHKTDGLHIRIRSSKTDQEAHGQVKALPYGRDPVTCPPCAYVRWREVLPAWGTAGDGARRREVLRVLRRQAAHETGGEGGVLQCCSTTQLPDSVDPGRALFPTIHRAGADAHAIMRQTGHRSPGMLEVYAPEHAPLVGNAVTTLGL